MKFKILVGYKERPDLEPWEEEYTEDIEDPVAWGKETIQSFNATLRPGERPRVLLGAEVIDPDAMPRDDYENPFEDDDDYNDPEEWW